MSGLEEPGAPSAAITLRACAADIIEIASPRGRAGQLQGRIDADGSMLPPAGQVAASADRWALCVRPERWLLLEPRRAAGVTAARWESDCAGIGTVVDLSSAFTMLDLAGAAAREALARGCRLDLGPGAFAPGRAARTLIAQVPVILAAHASGILLLAPSTMARHFREWLVAAARPFGLAMRTDPASFDLFGPSAGVSR